MDTIVESLAARPAGELQNREVMNGSGCQDDQGEAVSSLCGIDAANHPDALQEPGAGLEDVLLNEEIIDEDNENAVELPGVGDDQDNHVNDQNVVEEAEPDADVQFDCPALDAAPVDQQAIVAGSRLVQAVVSVVILFVCALLYLSASPDPVTTPTKSVSSCFNPLTQCPQSTNPATFVDHSVGTDGSWKVKYDDLKKKFAEMESALLDCKKTNEEEKEKFTLERGRAEMFLNHYLTLKGTCEDATDEPDWTDCLNKVSKAAQDKLDSVPKVVEHLDNTVQAGAKTLKSLGTNVTEGLRLAFLKMLYSFTTYSTDDREREETEKWTMNDRKEEHSYQSGGSADQPVYDDDNDKNPTYEEDFVINGVGEEEDYIEPKGEEAEEEVEDFSHSDMDHEMDIKMSGIVNGESNDMHSNKPTDEMFLGGGMFKKLGALPMRLLSKMHKMVKRLSGSQQKDRHVRGSCGTRRCKKNKGYQRWQANGQLRKRKANRKGQTTVR